MSQTETAQDTSSLETTFVSLNINSKKLKKELQNDNVNIKLTDSDETLELYHYIKCDNSSPDFVKNARGLIFHGDDLIVKSFPYTPEYINTDENLDDNIGNIDNYDVFKSIEGTLIRMFYHNNKWYLSTHRKLNAFKTKWSNRESFGNLFILALVEEINKNQKFKDVMTSNTNTEEVFNNFQNLLDVNKQYLFLLKNTSDNCIVCYNTEHKVYLVGTIVDGRLTYDTDLYDIESPERLKFDNIDDMKNYVNNIDFEQYPGVILFNKECNNIDHLKVLHSKYKYLYDLRGNESSIKFRYLNIRMDEHKIFDFLKLYHFKSDIFDLYENIIYSKAKEIYDSYVKRYIKKLYVTLPRDEYEIMKKAHEWYSSDRDNNKISIDKIIEILNEQSPIILNRLIKQKLITEKTNNDEKENVKLL